MEENSNTEVVARFYAAIERLIVENIIRGRQTFTTRYAINKRTFYNIEKDQTKKFPTSWLSHMVNDYKVSAHWLLTGEGDFFTMGWSAEKVREAFPYKRKPRSTKKEMQMRVSQ